MPGKHPFSELRRRMSPASRARAEEKARMLDQEMDLAELRRARELSQEELAQVLEVGQPAIAKMEKRTDMYISTLRRFIEAMGGELNIVARFPDHEVTITNFRDLADGSEEQTRL